MTTKIPVELSSTPGIVDSSNATAITINSSEQVGIGDTTPDARLKVNSTGGGSELAFKVADSSDNSVFEVQGGGTAGFQYGKLGIGTLTPDQMLHVSKDIVPATSNVKSPLDKSISVPLIVKLPFTIFPANVEFSELSIVIAVALELSDIPGVLESSTGIFVVISLSLYKIL